MWGYEACFYQFYTLGACGAPKENDGVPCNRLEKLHAFVPHLKKLGIDAVYFTPCFESDRHGYDTRDYGKIDCRLGNNEDFATLCAQFHENGMRVVLDGVFNHVGRGFWAFQDVLKQREQSPYRDWFHVDFNGNSNYNDGLWYEGWEGHFELVKLNLDNPAVVDHLLYHVGQWIDQFGIDGLRLDVAYLLGEHFLWRLREFCNQKKADFFLVGECIHGDYNRLLQHVDSVTNYECYKGLHSSMNSMNMFEIAHSLARQFGAEPWCLYRGRHLMSFVDNHDVSRVATVLQDARQLRAIYAMLFAMPGIPCLYYGSEWGQEGDKAWGDDALRPCFEAPIWNELTDFIAQLIATRKQSHALQYGNYSNLQIQNKYLVLERNSDQERVIVLINASDETHHAHFNANCGRATDLLSGDLHDFGGGTTVDPFAVRFWR